tara:strand:- start:37857 stop:39158 length:1302 start_codon:yes stop_codon:yes gene_type:complete
MLKMKRFIIFILALFCVVIVLVSCFLYFINSSDYSQWLSKQVKQTTGYDVRFKVLESNWLTENQFSVLGLSLYQQDRRIVYIDRLDVEIENLDLWSRQLQVKALHLKGVDIDINTSSTPSDNLLLNNNEDQQTLPLSAKRQNIEWEKLHLSHIQITGLNANVQHLDKKLSIKGANFDVNDVLVIDQQQLIILPPQLDISTQITHLSFNDEKISAQLQNVTLSTQGNLLTRQADLDFSVADIHLKGAEYPPIALNSLLMQLRLNTNTLFLKHFYAKAFSGELTAQADALFAINYLPKPDIKIEKIQLNSLIANDMDITIADFPYINQQIDSTKDQGLLPINSFLIKEMDLQNISLNSEIKQLPLRVTSAHVKVNNFEVIKDNKLWNMDSYSPQAGRFTLEFSQLSWQDSVIEEFSLAGSLEDKQDLAPLKQLLQ